MSDLVSIVIPTYNREKYISDCLDSVVRQIYRPIEIVVIDDGSTDLTIDILSLFAEKLANKADIFFKFKQVSNGGAPRARNIGFSESTGKFIVFMDSDDELLPNKISDQLALLQSEGYDVVFSPNICLDRFGNFRKLSGDIPVTRKNKDYVRLCWQTMGALYRREYILKMGEWDERLTINQDYEYSIRAVLFGGSIGFLSQPLQVYKQHSEENIGTQRISVAFVKSKEWVSKKIFNELLRQGIVDPFLKKAYFRKFFYCIILYGYLGDFKSQRNLLNYIYHLGIINRFLYVVNKLLLNKFISTLIYNLYIK
jgi:glycosyltransferase involved in cell wall biosynthesis